MPFGFDNIDNVLFGICIEDDNEDHYFYVPIHQEIVELAIEMLHTTVRRTQENAENAAVYEVGEKAGANDLLTIALADDLSVNIRRLTEAVNLQTLAELMDYVSGVKFYFFDYRDQAGSHCFGIRRSTQFKGLLKSRLVQLVDDSLIRASKPVFRLDPDFDLLVLDGTVIIRNSDAFEKIAKVDEQLEHRVQESYQGLKTSLGFMNLDGLDGHFNTHKRAKRLIEALRRRDDLGHLTIDDFRQAFQSFNIPYNDDGVTLTPDPGVALDILLLLDRRLYNDPLANVNPDPYEASSRKKRGP